MYTPEEIVSTNGNQTTTQVGLQISDSVRNFIDSFMEESKQRA